MLERLAGFSRNLLTRDKKEVAEAEPVLYLPNFDVLVISGYAGTGKTTAGEDVDQVMIGTRFIKVGETVRAENKDIINVAPETDFDIDQRQRQKMIDSQNSLPLIVESNFGSVLGKDVRKRLPEGPDIVTIFLTAGKDVRDERLIRRKKQDHPERTREEIIQEEDERERKFASRMKTLYPELLRGQDPVDPNITTVDGERIYDLVLDTTNLSKEQVGKALLKLLIENGLVSSFRREDFEKGELGNNDYELIKRGAMCENNGCQRLARQTLNSSVPGSIHSFAICSDEHALEKQTKIVQAFNEEDSRVRQLFGAEEIEIRFGTNGKFLTHEQKT